MLQLLDEFVNLMVRSEVYHYNPYIVTEKDQYFRPAATAAYLHAMRNQRPSFKIRNFVESPEPVTLRGTNHYDPSLLWTGLGRRRR